MIETYLKLSSSEEGKITCIGQTEQNGSYKKIRKKNGLLEEFMRHLARRAKI
jgi:hypothetical protein